MWGELILLIDLLYSAIIHGCLFFLFAYSFLMATSEGGFSDTFKQGVGMILERESVSRDEVVVISLALVKENGLGGKSVAPLVDALNAFRLQVPEFRGRFGDAFRDGGIAILDGDVLTRDAVVALVSRLVSERELEGNEMISLVDTLNRLRLEVTRIQADFMAALKEIGLMVGEATFGANQE